MVVHDRQRLERWYRWSLVSLFLLIALLGSKEYYGWPGWLTIVLALGLVGCALALGVTHERIRADQQRKIDQMDDELEG